MPESAAGSPGLIRPVRHGGDLRRTWRRAPRRTGLRLQGTPAQRPAIRADPTRILSGVPKAPGDNDDEAPNAGATRVHAQQRLKVSSICRLQFSSAIREITSVPRRDLRSQQGRPRPRGGGRQMPLGQDAGHHPVRTGPRPEATRREVTGPGSIRVTRCNGPSPVPSSPVATDAPEEHDDEHDADGNGCDQDPAARDLHGITSLTGPSRPTAFPVRSQRSLHPWPERRGEEVPRRPASPSFPAGRTWPRASTRTAAGRTSAFCQSPAGLSVPCPCAFWAVAYFFRRFRAIPVPCSLRAAESSAGDPGLIRPRPEPKGDPP